MPEATPQQYLAQTPLLAGASGACAGIVLNGEASCTANCVGVLVKLAGTLQLQGAKQGSNKQQFKSCSWGSA